MQNPTIRYQQGGTRIAAKRTIHTGMWEIKDAVWWVVGGVAVLS